jgi:hypothetical protein
MNTNAYMRSAVLEALEQYGFKDGKYGDVPFDILNKALILDDTDYAAAFYIMVSHRSMGTAYVHIDGTITVDLQMANWLNPKPVSPFTLGKPVVMGNMPIRKDVKVKYEDLAVRRYNVLERS